MKSADKLRGISEKGSLLILSLWIFLLLGLLAMSLAFRARLETRITKIREAAGPVPYAALSAVNLGRAALESDKEPEIDSRSDAWFGKNRGDARLPFVISIEDEESKINLNTVPPHVLENFFRAIRKEIRLTSHPDDWVAGILYWRGSSWIKKGAEKGVYYKKEPFESLDELLLIPGTRPEDAALLKPYFTVFPQGRSSPFKVNINTASDILLRVLIESLPGDAQARDRLSEQIQKFREGKLRASKTFSRNYFLTEDLTAETLLSRLQLASTSSLTALAIQLVSYVTVDSEYFTVRAALPEDTLKGYGVEAILGPGSGGDENDLTCLSWQRI